MAKKNEGAEVRVAYDGPKLEHDALIDQIEARSREEHERSSDASESAAKVAAFIEDTGMNTQAFSWCKTIMKKLPKKDGQAKAMDVIRSLEAGLPLIKAHVSGQGTGEMFPDDQPDDDADRDLDTETAPDVDQLIKDGDPDLAEDAKDFEAAADNVRPIKPIDFGTGAA